jgi:hypothetical protein
LEEGAEERGEEGRVWVGELVLVEVVDVGDTEVEGGEEDDVSGGGFGEEVEGDDGGAEDDFFGYGALGGGYVS